MNIISWILFPFISVYLLAPIINGCIGVINYKCSKIDYKKHEFMYLLLQLFVVLIIWIASVTSVLYLWFALIEYAITEYVISVLFFLWVSVTDSDKIYLPKEAIIDSPIKAFKKGLIESFSSNIFYVTKTFAHIIYIFILVISQIIALYFKDSWICDSEFYRFLEVNKYGIVIMYAFEKIISSISDKNRKVRKHLLKEMSDEREKEEQKEREERQQQLQEIKKLLKQIRLKRSEKKRQNKK